MRPELTITPLGIFTLIIATKGKYTLLDIVNALAILYLAAIHTLECGEPTKGFIGAYAFALAFIPFIKKPYGKLVGFAIIVILAIHLKLWCSINYALTLPAIAPIFTWLLLQKRKID